MEQQQLPEMVVFMGLPASGKSTFFKKEFSDSHVRVNLDMLKTRNRESKLIAACLESNQSLVIDNTNVKRSEREAYMGLARRYNFSSRLYCFLSSVKGSLERNLLREKSVPDVAIFSKQSQLEYPTANEGFDEVWYVRSLREEGFKVERSYYEV